MSTTTGTHAGPGVLQRPRPARGKSLLYWVGLSLIGFPLGGWLGYAVAGRVDSMMPALIGGALTGAAIAYWKRSYIYLLLGPLGAYVAGAPAFDVYKPWQMFLVGLGAPIVCYAVYEYSQRRQWDEHKLTPLFLGAGSYGLIMVGLVSWGTDKGGHFFLTEGDYAFQNAEINLLWQAIGTLVCIGVGIITALVLSFIFERTGGMRVPDDDQAIGLDAHLWGLEPEDGVTAAAGNGEPATTRVPTVS
jgi:ammonia channel protein AmtB